VQRHRSTTANYVFRYCGHIGDSGNGGGGGDDAVSHFVKA